MRAVMSIVVRYSAGTGEELRRRELWGWRNWGVAECLGLRRGRSGQRRRCCSPGRGR